MEPLTLKQARWNPWPASIITFYALAIAGCVSYVIFCNMHPAELVAPDYYEQELRYQGQMERAQRANGLSEQASIKYLVDRKLITISIPATHANGQTAGKVQLYRPSAAGLDQTFLLDVDTHGTQQIDARMLQPGLWTVKVTWAADGKDYFIDQKIRI